MTNDNPDSGNKPVRPTLAYDNSAAMRACILALDPMSHPPEWDGDNGVERART